MVRQLGDYQLSLPEPGVPAPTIAHRVELLHSFMRVESALKTVSCSIKI